MYICTPPEGHTRLPASAYAHIKCHDWLWFPRMLYPGTRRRVCICQPFFSSLGYNDLPKSSIIAPGYNHDCTSKSSNSNQCGLVWTAKSWIQRFSPKSFCFKNCVCPPQNLGYNDFIFSLKLFSSVPFPFAAAPVPLCFNVPSVSTPPEGE